MSENDKSIVLALIDSSSEMWLAARDRIGFQSLPILICRNPEFAYYLERVEKYSGNQDNYNGWIIEQRPLRMSDAADFFAAFGDHWGYWLDSTTSSGKIRAYIKNGRNEHWTVSLDMPTIV